MNYYERYDKYPSRIEGILLEEFGVMDDAPAIAGGGIISGKIIGEEEGDKVLTAELRVDTADDLPAYDSIEGYILRDCIALVVHTGDIWTQDSAGEWYNQTSPAAVTANTLNAPNVSNLNKDILKSEQTDNILGKADTDLEESLRSDENDIDV